MATSTKKMVGASDDSSSDDDEELRRCREAVWETRSGRNADEGISVKPSKRVVVDDHDHDGNELQVTQGFRTHVANKLELFLDSCITERKCKTRSLVEPAKCDDDDEGFRLFSTSIPGTTVEDPPAPARRRPVPSSSDSDSEMESRLREAAVSIKDLLPLAPAHSPAAEPPCSEQTRQEEGEEHCVGKKKKKKRNEEDGAPVDSPLNNGEHASSEQEHTEVRVKRKKKKKRKENSEDEASS